MNFLELSKELVRLLNKRTPAKKKAKEMAKLLRGEHPDYNYLRNVFKELRKELNIEVETKAKKLPYVPSDEELKRFYDAVWNSDNFNYVMIVKTFVYTGVRVNELVNIKITDINFNDCQIRINDGKGHKDRMVPFPVKFKELLAMHVDNAKRKHATYLFESSWKKNYTTRGIEKIFEKFSDAAMLSEKITPHKLRHFLFTWLKKQNIDDALIQPYSGHESRKSLEIYSRLSIKEAQTEYDKVIDKFPI